MRFEAEPADRLRAVLAGHPPPRRGPRRALDEPESPQPEGGPSPPDWASGVPTRPRDEAGWGQNDHQGRWIELEPIELVGAGMITGGDCGRGGPAESSEVSQQLSADEHARGRADQMLSSARAFTLRHLQAIGLVAVVVLVFVAVNLLRATSTEVPLEVAQPLPSTTAVSSPTSQASPTVASTLLVHVTGAVRKPGVVRVPAGARVNDAIAAAGGLDPSATLGSLNLAAPVSDGMQVVVGSGSSVASTTHLATPGDDSTGGSGSTATTAGERSGGLVNLNTASQAQLESLPGVGPVMAARIVEWREKNGKFSSVQELQEVDGVGAKTFERLKPLVTV